MYYARRVLLFLFIFCQLMAAPISSAIETVESEEVPEASNSTIQSEEVSSPILEPTVESHLQSVQQRVASQSVTQQEITLLPPIITEVQMNGSVEFVELYNPNDEPLALTGLKLRYHGNGTAPTIVQLVDLQLITMAPKSFAVFGHDLPADTIVTAPFNQALNNTVGAVLVYDTVSSQVVDKVAWGAAAAGSGYGYYDIETAEAAPVNNSLQRCFASGQVHYSDPRNTSTEFLVYSNDLPTPGVGLDCPLPAPPVAITTCSGIVISEIGANRDEQFIELHNPTAASIAIAGCGLQTNRSTTKVHTITQPTLEPNQYLTVFIHDTDLTLTKTTSGTVYLLSSDGQSEADVQMYNDLVEETSWSRFTDGWRQTYAVTPGMDNINQPYLPCNEGYFRNLETGRCNLIPVDDPLTPCEPGKYRSEDTGRCRTVVAVDTRKPCQDDQYRSEETGRCRNIVTAASTRKPCNDNQYRSEETGRCRNLAASSVPDAAFAVQPVKDTGMAFVGWWALGGVSLLALGYAGWEWRREILTGVKRAISVFSSNR